MRPNAGSATAGVAGIRWTGSTKGGAAAAATSGTGRPRRYGCGAAGAADPTPARVGRSAVRGSAAPLKDGPSVLRCTGARSWGM
ncbi:MULTISPECIES: hypothetical protein [unclassified Streptomyces]|uniref:hypothetical protein n=1 Tax=unclassified Streptomyces TaxID=2593676 RepID=UPI00136F1AA9|nr:MULTISPECIES: hypothetical protein [unclassified Streptomyces]MYS22456.1 hypothetical protein [Streptomyces sp. SID4948]